MRKRGKPRKRGPLTNTLIVVGESTKPLDRHGDYLVDLRIRNHAAMASLVKGSANTEEFRTLLGASNVTQAACQLKLGAEYQQVADAGQTALYHIALRAQDLGRYVCKAEEINALNLMLELHDAQLDTMTVRDIERAIETAKAMMQDPKKVVHLPKRATHPT